MRSTRNPASPIDAQYGALDTRIAEGWPAYANALAQAGIPHEGHIYPGANHGFCNDTTPRYDEQASNQAWPAPWPGSTPT